MSLPGQRILFALPRPELLQIRLLYTSLTSSGNVLFLDSDNLQQAFENSELNDYGDIQKFNKK